MASRRDEAVRQGYITLDSGKRQSYESGMVRDLQEGKLRYDLLYWPMVDRAADLMGRGLEKYGERNWELASSWEEYRRFRASALRHAIQNFKAELLWERMFFDPSYECTEEDLILLSEDHAAATFFNHGGTMYVRTKLERQGNE